MRSWVAAALAAASLFGAGLVAPAAMAPAAAAEGDAIDCSSTPFAFSGEGYLVDCARYESQARKDGASGQSQSDVITVTSDQRSMFLTMISIRLTSAGLHMRYQNLREAAHGYFNVDLSGWNGLGYKGGYDTAEFTADIRGQPSRCIAIQRYMNPYSGGYKRHLIGMGCAVASLEPVYAALAKLRAPGD